VSDENDRPGDATPTGAVVALDDLPKIVAEALELADRRREQRATSQQATANLQGMRQQFAAQLDLLERLQGGPPEDSPIGHPDPTVLELADETRKLLAEIDAKLIEGVRDAGPMILESIRQARAALNPEQPRIELLPPGAGAALIASKGKRR
jgi:hypothetical protein